MLQSERAKMMTMQEHQTAYVQRASFSREGATVFLGHLDHRGLGGKLVHGLDRDLLLTGSVLIGLRDRSRILIRRDITRVR